MNFASYSNYLRSFPCGRANSVAGLMDGSKEDRWTTDLYPYLSFGVDAEPQQRRRRRRRRWRP